MVQNYKICIGMKQLEYKHVKKSGYRVYEARNTLTLDDGQFTAEFLVKIINHVNGTVVEINTVY